MDHYETLEVSRNASPEVIRAAYKSLMQRLHPDKHPDGEAIAGRAAQIARAYEVLSNADQRVAYDRDLRGDLGQGAQATDEAQPFASGVHGPALARGARRQVAGGRGASVGPAGLGSRYLPWLLLLMLMAAGIWALARWDARKSDPHAELASIRQAFASVDVTEAGRRELAARKLAILARQPELLPTENAEKAEEMAARTFALLDAPLSVRMNSATPGAAGPAPELIIARVSLLVGTFDAQRHLAHMATHRERLTSALSERLVKVDPGRLASPQSAVYLKKVMLDSIVATLGTDPAQAYPSTYFESPGRYGVIDLVLPEDFKLVQPGSARE